MRHERRSIVTVSQPQSAERSRLPGGVDGRLERTLVELGKLAISRQLSLTAECLLMMAQDLADVPSRSLETAITGWRKGTLKMGKPEQMDRFPTVRQLRAQAELLELESK